VYCILTGVKHFINRKLTVPMRTYLPDVAVTGRAVCAVRGVLSACSIVPGRADWVPGRAKPLRGRPDWDVGLHTVTTLCWSTTYSQLYVGLAHSYISEYKILYLINLLMVYVSTKCRPGTNHIIKTHNLEFSFGPTVCSQTDPPVLQPVTLWPSPWMFSSNDSLFLVASITKY